MGKFLQAALVILDTEKRPMRAREITILAKRRGLLDFSNGDTPWDTMKAKLSVDIKLYGLTSSFKRVEPGMYALREFERGEYYAPPRAFPKVVRPNDYVLVFRADSVADLGSFQGIRKAFHPYERTLLNPRYTTFIPRIQAETDPQYKQVVSYVIVKKADSVLRFVRGKYTSVEDFLKGSYCIGFGGHVQKTDADSWPLLAALDNDSGYMNSLYRELFEELKLPREITAKRVRTIGALNDDSSAVGRLHFAFVHLLDITEVPVGEARTLRREKSVNQLAFVPITKLAEEFEKYEYWSKLCIKTFFGDAVQLPCRIRKVRNFSLRHHSRYIVVCGGIGSGKTEACRVLEKRFGYHTISSGQVLQQLLNVDLRSVGRVEFQKLAQAFIDSTEGPEQLAAAIYEQIQRGGNCRYAIDGIRQVATLESLRQRLHDALAVIYVDATPDNAYRFYRNRESHDATPHDFFALLDSPVERNVDNLMRLAGVVIYNHGDKQAYLKSVERFFRRELIGERSRTVRS